MINKSTLIFLFFCLNTVLFAQAPSIQWQRCIGGTQDDRVGEIASTSDGGFIIAGSTNSNDGDALANLGTNFWLVKIDINGNIQWQKSLGGTNVDYAASVKQTADGGYIIAGTKQSSDGDATVNYGSDDFWVVKTDAVGNIQWQKTLGGSGQDMAKSVIQCADGGFVVVGETDSYDVDVVGQHCTGIPCQGDIWIVKLSSTGNVLWKRTMGGSDWDVARSVTQDSSGNIVVVGLTCSSNGDVFGSHGNADVWLIKLTNTGTVLSNRVYGGSGIEHGNSVFATSDGGYIIAGISNMSNGDVTSNHGGLSDYWVIKLNPNLTIKWQKSFGGSNRDIANSVIETQGGNFIVTGTTPSYDGDLTGNYGSYDSWTFKLDSNGNIIWKTILGGGGDDTFLSLKATPDGGYILVGNTTSNEADVSGNHGVNDIWVVKLGPDLIVPSFNNLGFYIYPNPGQNFLHVSTNDNSIPDQIVIRNISGQIVYCDAPIIGSIDVSHISSGVYIVEVAVNDRRGVLKWVKE